MAAHCSEHEVSQELAGVITLDPEALRRRWRSLTGRAVPEHLPRHILIRLLAYRIQAHAFGDLDAKSIKLLHRIAERTNGNVSSGVPTLESLSLSSRGAGHLSPGTVLGREHGGVMHHVMVLADGFAWNGATYRSLSEVAFAITGTRWNGPRFFGLGERKARRATAKGTGS